jgi:hypothetical protein
VQIRANTKALVVSAWYGSPRHTTTALFVSVGNCFVVRANVERVELGCCFVENDRCGIRPSSSPSNSVFIASVGSVAVHEDSSSPLVTDNSSRRETYSQKRLSAPSQRLR